MAQAKNLITCVCTANICRSPMAEKLMQHALAVEAAPLNEWTVVSSGVSALSGEGASPNSVRALKKVGIELANHRSKQITREMMEQSVVILCMTESHRYIINQLFPDHGADVQLMRGLMPAGCDPQIPDPYGLDLRAYEACRDSMVEAIPHILNYLRGKVS